MSERTESTTTETESTEAGKEDVAGLKSALDKERELRKTAEKTSKDLEKRLATIESSDKSDSEKLTARLEALEQDNKAKSAAIQQRDAKDAANDVAKKAGAPDPDLVYRVIRSDIEFDDDGKATNVKQLIDDLKQVNPTLFKASAGKADAGAGNSGKSKNFDMNSQIRQMAGHGT